LDDIEKENSEVLTPAMLPRAKRIPYRTEVSTSIAMFTISGTCVNLSRGGLFVNSSETDKVTPGTDVAITFALPRDNRLVKIDGRIAWVNRGPQRPSAILPQGFAVQFKAISPEIRRNIESFIDKRLAGPAPSHLYN